MADATALLNANLHEVFSERDPDARRAAIERTYAEDVKFIDPDREVVGQQALNERAQELLDRAPADYASRRTAPGTSVLTRPLWRGALVRQAVHQWPAGSTSSRCVMDASSF